MTTVKTVLLVSLLGSCASEIYKDTGAVGEHEPDFRITDHQNTGDIPQIAEEDEAVNELESDIEQPVGLISEDETSKGMGSDGETAKGLTSEVYEDEPTNLNTFGETPKNIEDGVEPSKIQHSEGDALDLDYKGEQLTPEGETLTGKQQFKSEQATATAENTDTFTAEKSTPQPNILIKLWNILLYLNKTFHVMCFICFIFVYGKLVKAYDSLLLLTLFIQVTLCVAYNVSTHLVRLAYDLVSLPLILLYGQLWSYMPTATRAVCLVSFIFVYGRVAYYYDSLLVWGTFITTIMLVSLHICFPGLLPAWDSIVSSVADHSVSHLDIQPSHFLIDTATTLSLIALFTLILVGLYMYREHIARYVLGEELRQSELFTLEWSKLGSGGSSIQRLTVYSTQTSVSIDDTYNLDVRVTPAVSSTSLLHCTENREDGQFQAGDEGDDVLPTVGDADEHEGTEDPEITLEVAEEENGVIMYSRDSDENQLENETGPHDDMQFMANVDVNELNLQDMYRAGYISEEEKNSLRAADQGKGHSEIQSTKLLGIFLNRKENNAWAELDAALVRSGQQHTASEISKFRTDPIRMSIWEHTNKVLQAKRSELVKVINLDNSGLYSAMRSNGLIGVRDEASIREQGSNDKQVECLLDLLPMKGKDALEKFCDALIKSGQEHVVTTYLKDDGGTNDPNKQETDDAEAPSTEVLNVESKHSFSGHEPCYKMRTDLDETERHTTQSAMKGSMTDVSVKPKRERHILEVHRDELVKRIELELGDLYTCLRTVGLLTPREEQDIRCVKSKEEQVECLLDFIMKKGEEGFEQFCEALKMSKQEHIVNEILKPVAGREVECDTNINEASEVTPTCDQALEHGLPTPNVEGGRDTHASGDSGAAEGHPIENIHIEKPVIHGRKDLEILRTARPRLVESIDLKHSNLYTVMRTTGIIDEREENRLKAAGTNDKQVEALLDLLPRKGENVLNDFCSALKESEQNHIVTEILKMEPCDEQQEDVTSASGKWVEMKSDSSLRDAAHVNMATAKHNPVTDFGDGPFRSEHGGTPADMDGRKEMDILETKRPQLVSAINLISSSLYSELRALSIITAREQEDIGNEGCNERQVERLLDFLHQKKQNVLYEFCEALKNSNQGHIVTEIIGLPLSDTKHWHSDSNTDKMGIGSVTSLHSSILDDVEEKAAAELQGKMHELLHTFDKSISNWLHEIPDAEIRSADSLEALETCLSSLSDTLEEKISEASKDAVRNIEEYINNHMYKDNMEDKTDRSVKKIEDEVIQKTHVARTHLKMLKEAREAHIKNTKLEKSVEELKDKYHKNEMTAQVLEKRVNEMFQNYEKMRVITQPDNIIDTMENILKEQCLHQQEVIVDALAEHPLKTPETEGDIKDCLEVFKEKIYVIQADDVELKSGYFRREKACVNDKERFELQTTIQEKALSVITTIHEEICSSLENICQQDSRFDDDNPKHIMKILMHNIDHHNKHESDRFAIPPKYYYKLALDIMQDTVPIFCSMQARYAQKQQTLLHSEQEKYKEIIKKTLSSADSI